MNYISKTILGALLSLSIITAVYGQEKTTPMQSPSSDNQSLVVKPANGDAQKNADNASTETLVAKSTDTKSDVNDSNKADNSSATPAVVDAECKLCRWLDLQNATISTRYRYNKSSDDVYQVNQNHVQQIYDFRIKFDKEGKYSLNTHLSSGYYFTRSFAETGLGDTYNEKGWAVFPRWLYLSLKPVKGVEIQYGGLNILRGETSENISYDNDGFITGERISIKRPKNFFFDEISVTNAYIGDYYTPNFFNRAKRLSKANYHQFLVAKKINDRISLSADYTLHTGIGIVREGLKVNTPELHLVDSIRFGSYQRLELLPNWGYEVVAEKTIAKRLTLGAGFVFVDYDYNILNTNIKYPNLHYIQVGGTLNADRVIRGHMPIAQWKYIINDYWSINGFWKTNLSTPPKRVYNNNVFVFAVAFDIKKLLQKTSLF